MINKLTIEYASQGCRIQVRSKEGLVIYVVFVIVIATEWLVRFMQQEKLVFVLFSIVNKSLELSSWCRAFHLTVLRKAYLHAMITARVPNLCSCTMCISVCPHICLHMIMYTLFAFLEYVHIRLVHIC